MFPGWVQLHRLSRAAGKQGSELVSCLHTVRRFAVSDVAYLRHVFVQVSRVSGLSCVSGPSDVYQRFKTHYSVLHVASPNSAALTDELS